MVSSALPGMTRDRIGVASVWVAGILVTAALVAIVASSLTTGGSAISFSYLWSMPERAGIEGGIGSVVIGTVLLLVVAVAVAAPVGLLAAVLLFEATRTPRLARLVTRSLDVLACVPSIVFGLFGMRLFCEVLGLGWSVLAGGLTLACMIMPVVVRSTQQALCDVGSEQRMACAALGSSRCGALVHVLVPTAAPGIVAGLLLGSGRALAETAAVLYTAGSSLRMPESLGDPGRALAVHVYTLAIEIPGGGPRASSAALVLLLMVAVTNVAAWVGSSAFRRWRLGAAA